MFAQIEQTPRYKIVAKQIAELIVAKKLPHGSKMPTDRELVEMLGVSRATVREAIIALEISGFVENRFGAGAYVSKSPPYSSQLTGMNDPGPFELLQARRIIEGEIASVAAEYITPDDILHLEKCIDQMRSEKAAWGENADEEFHVSIARITRNQSFVNIVTEFWRQRTRMPMWVQMHNRVNLEDMRSDLVSEHTEIVKALKAGDSSAAGQSMRKHICSFAKSLLEKWNDLGEDARSGSVAPDERLVRELV